MILNTETHAQTVTDFYEKLKRTLIHVLNTRKTEAHVDTCIKHPKTETHGDIDYWNVKHTKTETHGDTDFYEKLKCTLIHVLNTRKSKRTVILITETHVDTDFNQNLKRTLIHVLNPRKLKRMVILKTEMHKQLPTFTTFKNHRIR